MSWHFFVIIMEKSKRQSHIPILAGMESWPASGQVASQPASGTSQQASGTSQPARWLAGCLFGWLPDGWLAGLAGCFWRNLGCAILKICLRIVSSPKTMSSSVFVRFPLILSFLGFVQVQDLPRCSQFFIDFRRRRIINKLRKPK